MAERRTDDAARGPLSGAAVKRRGFIASLFGGVAVAFGLRPEAPAIFTIVKNPRRHFASVPRAYFDFKAGEWRRTPPGLMAAMRNTELFDEHGNPVHGSALREGDTIIAAEMTDA